MSTSVRLSCCICFEEASNPTVTSCGHLFCREHIKEWLKREHSCPVCRRQVSSNKGLIEVHGEEEDWSAGNSALSEDKETEKAGVLSMLSGLRKRWDLLLMERSKLKASNDQLKEQNRSLKELLAEANEKLDAERSKRDMHESKYSAKSSDKYDNANAKINIGRGDRPPLPAYGSVEGSSSKLKSSAASSAPRPPCPRAVERLLMSDCWAIKESVCVHKEPVHGIAVHGKRHLVASASWDHTAKLYDLDRGRVLCKLSGVHQKGLYAVRFSEMQSHLCGTVSSDHTCCIWDIDTTECVRTLKGHRDEVNGLAFHSTRNEVATASDDRSVILWDLATGKSLQCLTGHRNSVYGLCFQPAAAAGEGALLATVSFDWMTLLWDARAGTIVQALEGHRDDIIGVDFDCAGQLLATGSDDGTCWIWDLRMWRNLAVLRGHDSEVKRVAFSPYGRSLATTSGDGTARLWDTRDFGCYQVLEGHDDHVHVSQSHALA